MASQLEVEIGASTTKLKKSLLEAEKLLTATGNKVKGLTSDLKKLDTTSLKTSRAIDMLNKEFKEGSISEATYNRNLTRLTNLQDKLAAKSRSTATQLNKLNTSAKRLGSSGFKGAGKGAANAVPAMTEFSRVIQDAPFGIQGVANNIQQLTGQFGHLSTKLGGSKAALKAMLGTLAGPTGILLAVSVITSLLVAFSGQLFKTKDATDKVKEAQDALNKSLDNYINGLDTVSKSSLKAAQSAAKETTNLRLLRDAAEDTTLKMVDRLKAVKELQRLYPDYLGNVSREKVLNGEVAKTFDILTGNILKRAKATAALNKIIKNSEQLLTLESQAATKKAEIDKKAIQLQNANLLAQRRAGKERAGTNFSVQRAIELQSEYNNLVKDGAKIQGQINEITLDNKSLEDAISKVGGVRGGGATTIPVNGKLKVESLVDTDFEPVLADFSSFGVLLGGALEETALLMKPIDWTGIFNAQHLANQILETEAKMNAFNDKMRMTLETGLEGSLGGIGSAIGEALANGGNVIDSIGAVLLSSLGSILVQIGKMAIAIGVGLKAIKSALTSLNPLAAIAAGVGLIALGSFFSAQSKSIGNNIGGGGGSSSSGSSGSSTPSFPSTTRASSGFSGGGGGLQNVVFEIAGTKLVGVISNTLQRNKNLGGSLSVTT